jgi:hypothetical protein
MTAKLLHCTLTGADDTTSIDDLFALQDRFPFVEWGILYSESQRGIGRYPSGDWLVALTDRLQAEEKPRSFALHVCGRAVRDLLAGAGEVCRVASVFPRIQINFRAADYPLEQIRATLRRHGSQSVITQHNSANETLWKDLACETNHTILFDTSGGRGIAPASWPAPLPTALCGYAGGLGPGNIRGELPAIRRAARGTAYWIDMEGKLRDAQDRFDLNAARNVLEAVQDFLMPAHVG